jgi:hypothetical protein
MKKPSTRSSNVAGVEMDILTGLARVFASLFFALPGVLALGCGAILLFAESNPVRELRQDELDAIALSARYLSEHHQATGNYPTDQEFIAWRDKNKERLPTTTKLYYIPPFGSHTRYGFELKDGDCPVTWYSDLAGSTKAHIKPECYFMFGRTKLRAVTWCFVVALLYFGIAYLFARPFLQTPQR